MYRTDSEPLQSRQMSIHCPPLYGRYDIRRSIGKGGFGLVYLCRDLYTDTFVALKCIPAATVRSEAPRLVREVEIMLTLSNAHPHVMSILNVFLTRTNTTTIIHDSLAGSDAVSCSEDILSRLLIGCESGLNRDELLSRFSHWMFNLHSNLSADDEFDVNIVLPLMHGDLHHVLRPKQQHAIAATAQAKNLLRSVLAVPFAFQIAFALDYLHKCNVTHRDLKPDNVLVWIDTQTPLKSSVFLSDFGLARDQCNSSSTWYVCTRWYRPPEVILRMGTPDSTIDVWSLGCILYEIATHEELFRLPTSRDGRGRYDTMRASAQLAMIVDVIGSPSIADVDRFAQKWSSNVLRHLRSLPPTPSRLSDAIREKWILDSSADQSLWIDLISACLAFFPEQRCTAEEVCRHSLFQMHGIFYNDNVTQFEPRVYVAHDSGACSVNWNLKECKRRLLEMAVGMCAPRHDLSTEEAAVQKKVKTPPLAPMLDESEGPPLMALSLPPFSDREVGAVVHSLPVDTDSELQDAINTVVQLLLDHTHDPVVSAELQLALRFFTTVRDLPKTEVVHNAFDNEDDSETGPFYDDIA